MQSFYNRFVASAEKLPNHVIVELQKASPSTEVESYTFADLRNKAESIGRWLESAGIKPGDRCAILGLNSPSWAAAYLGILARGAVAVPLDTAFKSSQVAKLLDDCEASVLFTDQTHLDAAKDAVCSRKTKLVLLEGATDGLPALDAIFATGPGNFAAHQSAADDVAVILYTSGTTSDPKGVMLTHANLDAEAKAIFDYIRIDERDAILGVLPLFHALAQMANLLVPFSSGCRVVYLEQLNTGELLRGLRDRRITLFCCVPQFFYLIHEKVMKGVAERSQLQQLAFGVMMRLARIGRSLGINLGRLFFGKVHQTLGAHMRYLITGGSRFDTKIGQDLETLGFDILQAYGLTECCGGATVTPLKARFIGSVGKPLKSVDVKVIDSGIPELESNGCKTGEVLIRGPIVMKGYYNRPDATAEMLRDGWLYTGDLGHIDDSGHLFITGRKKDVIVLSSGKNIYPEEIEAHYLQSPWIKEICVVGLQNRPGEPLGERLHGIVVPDMDVLREKKVVNMKEVLRFDIESLSAQITAGKRILSYEIWQSELPRTTTRKLKRHEIQKAVENKQQAGAVKHEERKFTDEERAWLEKPMVQQAIKVIAQAAKEKRPIHPSDNLELELGLDSMERVELVVALENALQAQADPNMISEVYTVRELIEAVIAGRGATPGRLKAGWDEVFKRESTDPGVTDILEPRPIATRLWYAFGCCVSAMCKIMFRLETTGLERLPKSGPFVLCPNHQSFLDGPVVTSQMPFHLHKDLFYVGTSEIFGSGFMRKVARSIKLIPVDPDANLVPAMKAGAFGLAHGKILVLYPEGERSIDGTPKIFKKGAAILAVHHNVPVVPVALEGFHEAWPRGKGFQGFRKLRITIGDPIYPPKDAASLDEAYETMTRQLKDDIMQLWLPMHERNTGRAAAARQTA